MSGTGEGDGLGCTGPEGHYGLLGGNVKCSQRNLSHKVTSNRTA